LRPEQPASPQPAHQLEPDLAPLVRPQAEDRELLQALERFQPQADPRAQAPFQAQAAQEPLRQEVRQQALEVLPGEAAAAVAVKLAETF